MKGGFPRIALVSRGLRRWTEIFWNTWIVATPSFR